MDSLKNKIFSSEKSNKILFWHRYQAIILTCLLDSNRGLEEFLNIIKKLYRNIKITLEQEVNSSINFLDIVQRLQEQLKFSTLREPTQQELIIPND